MIFLLGWNQSSRTTFIVLKSCAVTLFLTLSNPVESELEAFFYHPCSKKKTKQKNT